MPFTAGLSYSVYHSQESKHVPIVLIHGAGGTHLSWPPEIRRLVGYDVYAVDLSGHGKSESFGEQNIEAYAEQVVAWMFELQLYRVFLVGHSMGGAVGISIARKAPERIAGLALLGVGTPMEIPRDVLENLSHPAMVSTALSNIHSLSFGKNPDPQLVARIYKLLAETRSSVLRGDFLACQNFNPLETLSGVTKPVLLVAGGQDQIVPLRHVQLLAKKIKGAELVVIPEAGHLLMLEKPRQVAEILKSFLNRMNVIP